MKQPILLVVFFLVLADYCKAQPVPPPTPPTPRPRPVIPTLKATFQADRDFYLRVDGYDYGKLAKDNRKEIALKEGPRKVVFEEADSTGERVERIFQVTAKMIRRGDTVYTVTFKTDIEDILQFYTGNTTKAKPSPQVQPLNETDQKEKAVAKQLLEQMVRFAAGTAPAAAPGVAEVQVGPLNFGKYEVTQKQWEDVMGPGANKSAQKACPNCPVENVSWNEVSLFVEKLNKVSPQKFRLPTEAEWVFVAEQITAKEYGVTTRTGELEAKQKRLFERTAWYNKKAPQSVGKMGDAMGIHDLFGNVAEWCADAHTAVPTNGAASSSRRSTSAERKAIKGGSYEDSPEALDFMRRDSELSSARRKTVGFRLVTDAR